MGVNYYVHTGIEDRFSRNTIRNIRGRAPWGAQIDRRYTWQSQNIANGRVGKKSAGAGSGLSGESKLSKTGFITHMRIALIIRLKNANNQNEKVLLFLRSIT